MDERIKHIRQIHFLMLAISFAVFVTINFSSGNLVQKALTDLQTINSGLKTWNNEFLLLSSKNKNPVPPEVKV